MIFTKQFEQTLVDGQGLTAILDHFAPAAVQTVFSLILQSINGILCHSLATLDGE